MTGATARRASDAEHEVAHRIEEALLQRRAENLVARELEHLPAERCRAGRRERDYIGGRRAHIAKRNAARAQVAEAERRTARDMHEPPQILRREHRPEHDAQAEDRERRPERFA